LDDSLSVLLKYCDQYSHSITQGLIGSLKYEGNINDIYEDEFIKDGRKVQLNDENKEEYIKFKIKEKLNLLDMKEYNAIRKGFHFYELENHLSILNASELMILLNGSSGFIDAHMVLSQYEFSDRWGNSCYIWQVV